MSSRPCRRIGIVGYGHVGAFLVSAIREDPDIELGWVWNRSTERLIGEISDDLILNNLDDFASRHVDLIVEVAHPNISKTHGVAFLEHADYMVGSPTALADSTTEIALREQAAVGPYGLYVPSGAFWGALDILKMADRGTLKSLKVTMKKQPQSYKLNGSIVALNEGAKCCDKETILYDGPVRELCSLAPNNVNTMAAAAIAAHNLGFDGVQGCIIADPRLDCHIVDIDVTGPGPDGSPFVVNTHRVNPASTGAVTGSATYVSFYSSMIKAKGQGSGVHLC